MIQKLYIALVFSVLFLPACAMEEGATFVAKGDTLPDYSSRDAIVEYLFAKLAEKDKKAATSYKTAYTKADTAGSLIIKMYHKDSRAVLLYGLSFVHTMTRYTLIHNPASSVLPFCLSNGQVESSREAIMKGVRLMKGLAILFLQQNGIYANDYSKKCGGEEIDAADIKYFDLIYDSFDLFLRNIDPKHPLYEGENTPQNDDTLFGITSAYHLDPHTLKYSEN